MKLLIITQAVDTQHPILGFFHRWIEEFAKHCEVVHVICLEKGQYSFPANVHVHSLGKEEGKGRLTYLWRFYSYIWNLRHEYDRVFVHMNHMYVIIGSILWKALRKKVGLWYAHGAVPPLLYGATFFSNVIFTSTPEGFRIKTKKLNVIGQGIDTLNFVPDEKKPASKFLRLITVGRITQSKNLETLIQNCSLLKEKNLPFTFSIIGSPITQEEKRYQIKIDELIISHKLEKEIKWVGAVSNRELPKYLQQADVFIHDGATNSLDKALLEAVLCGCIVVSSNPAYISETQEIAPEYLYNRGDGVQLAKIVESIDLHDPLNKRIRSHFNGRYTIQNLISGIVIKLA